MKKQIVLIYSVVLHVMLMLCTLVLMLEFNITFTSIKIANTIALVMHIWIFNHVAINSFSNATFSVTMMGLLLVLALSNLAFCFPVVYTKQSIPTWDFPKVSLGKQNMIWKMFSVGCCSNQALLWIKPNDENIVQPSLQQNAITSKAYSKKTY